MATCMAASAVKFCQMTHDFFSRCAAAIAVKFCPKTRDFFSKFYRDLNSIFFFVEFVLDSTYMRAVDFGRYFSPKITLRLILESTNRQVYRVSIKHINQKTNKSESTKYNSDTQMQCILLKQTKIGTKHCATAKTLLMSSYQ